MRAIQEYQKRSGRMFPTWSEVLDVRRGLGYEKVEVPDCIPSIDTTTPAVVADEAPRNLSGFSPGGATRKSDRRRVARNRA